MKSDYLAILEQKEILLKENEQYKDKIKELEIMLNNKESNINNINYILSREIELNILKTNEQVDENEEIQKLNNIIIQLKSQINEQEKNLKIDKEDISLQLNEKILEKEFGKRFRY